MSDLRPITFSEIDAKYQILNTLHGPIKKREGSVPKQSNYNVMDALISTLLSQNTNDRNSGRAFTSLKERFVDWESCRAATEAEIEDAIKQGGLSKIKAKRIKSILDGIYEDYGKTDLEFLHDKSDDQIKEILTKYKGVGPKTIACVLMFQLHRDDFPVDTHVFRVSKRIGWVPPKFDREKTYEKLNKEIPDEFKYPLHILLIRHGRNICKSNNPRCDKCALQQSCNYGLSLNKEEVDQSEAEEDEEFVAEEKGRKKLKRTQQEVKKEKGKKSKIEEKKSLSLRRRTPLKTEAKLGKEEAIVKKEEVSDIEDILPDPNLKGSSEYMYVCGGKVPVAKTKRKS